MAEVKAVKVSREALRKQLSVFEEPVEGQVPSEVFIGLQARNRIKEAALRNKDPRSFFQGAVKVRSIAEASKAIVKQRREARKQQVRARPVVCDVCPKLVELPGQYLSLIHI